VNTNYSAFKIQGNLNILLSRCFQSGVVDFVFVSLPVPFHSGYLVSTRPDEKVKQNIQKRWFFAPPACHAQLKPTGLASSATLILAAGYDNDLLFF
jgi:hypothetical protein